MRFFNRFMPFVLLLGDTVTIASAIVLAYWTRGVLFEPNDIALEKYLLFFPLYLVPLLVFVYEGLYRYRYDFWQELRYILQAIALSFLIVFAYLALTKTVEHYSRFVIGMSFFYMAILLPLQKRLLKWFFYHIGWWKKEVKLYGSAPIAQQGIFDNYYVGYVQSDENAQTIVLNARGMEIAQIDGVLKEEIRKHHELLFIPLLRDFNLSQSLIYDFFNERTNLILLKNRLASKRNLLTKELFDRAGALMLTFIALPIMGIVTLVLFVNSPSIFYRQKRLGKGGKVFELLKFRTMKPNAAAILEEYLRDNPQKRREWETFRKLKEYDPRVTRVGRFLRKYSLDELPQLFNVLKGEMSLVGPRPYIPDELEKLEESKEIILSVKPGITGLWQVLGRNELSFEERVAIDRWYVYNWSLWLDFVILLKTFRAVFEKAH